MTQEPLFLNYIATVLVPDERGDLYFADVLVFGTDLDDARENARRKWGDRLVDVQPDIDPEDI